MAETLQTTYDRIAEDWYADHLKDQWSNVRVQLFSSYFSPGTRVLDVGCGPGIKARLLLDAGLRVHGTDFSENMIEICRRTCPDGTFAVDDIRNPALSAETYDGILAFAILLHVPKTEAASVIQTLVRQLNPGGLLMVAVKTVNADGLEETVVTEDGYGYPFERFFSFYFADEMREHFRNAGLVLCYDETYPPTGKSWSVLIGRKE